MFEDWFNKRVEIREIDDFFSLEKHVKRTLLLKSLVNVDLEEKSSRDMLMVRVVSDTT